MRDIKFRAWDNDAEEMLLPDDCFLRIDFTGNVFIRNIRVIEERRFELMQYTGLKDKNGKEIYEEDILKCKKGYGKIIYKSDEQDCGFWIDWIKNPEHWNNYLHVRLDEIEIIGNIYANTELLS